MPTENKSNKIITIVLAVIIILAVITVIYISLPQNKEKTTGGNNEQQGGGNQTTESVILTVTYGDKQTNYTLHELENLTSYTGMGGYRTSFPIIKGQGNYTGVNVTTLVRLTAGNINNYSITAYTSIPDNKTYTFDMIQGNVDIYNATNASSSTPIGHGNVTMILSYMKDGDYLNESNDGKLKIAFVNDKKELITKSGLWWSHIVSIEIAKQ